MLTTLNGQLRPMSVRDEYVATEVKAAEKADKNNDAHIAASFASVATLQVGEDDIHRRWPDRGYHYLGVVLVSGGAGIRYDQLGALEHKGHRGFTAGEIEQVSTHTNATHTVAEDRRRTRL